MKMFLAIILSIFLFANVFAQDEEKECTDCEACLNQHKNQKFVGVQGAGISAIGHFEEGWKDGSAGYITYGVVYDDNWTLILQTGYITFNANHEETVYLGDVEPKLNMVPLMVGTRYYAMRGVVRPFLFGMGGINIIAFDYIAERNDPPSIEITNGTEVKLNFSIGLGVGILVYEGLEIEAQLKYNSHALDSSVPYNATGTEIGIALNWNLE